MNIPHYFWEINCWLVLVAAVVRTVNTQADAEVLTVRIWRFFNTVEIVLRFYWCVNLTLSKAKMKEYWLV